MPLVTPKILGPLSELSDAVRVQGQLSGAAVTVISLKPKRHDVATGVAKSGDQSFPLLQGVQLSAKDRLVAVQKLDGELSPEPPESLAMGVQPKPQQPNEVGRVGFVTHLYECGRCVFISGAIPGAMVELTATSSGALMGKGKASEGDARFGLISGGLHYGESAAARQVVPGLPAGPETVRTPDPLPVQPGASLPAPVLHPPIRVCDGSVLVTGVIDGATVTVQHGSGLPPDVSLSDLPGGGWFFFREPLKDGDVLTVRQEVDPRCERKPAESKATLAPLKPLNPPTVIPHLCAGARQVTVTDCRPGALIKISVDGKTWKGQLPPDRISLDFWIEPLTGGSVRATQTLCGVESDPSFPPVPVSAHAHVETQPEVVRPLYACARCVSVNNVHPGATLQVWTKSATSEAPISGFVPFWDTQGTILVAPYLREGEDVYVIQWACSEIGLKSRPVRVQPAPFLPKPTVWRPISGDTAVQIKDSIPGAWVEVYVSRETPTWVLAGAGVADPLKTPVLIPCFAMKAGDFVRARQSLCGTLTEFGDPVQVFVPKPLMPDHLSPAAGATNVSIQPTLSWADPGAIEERRATQYEVQVLLGNQTVVPSVNVLTTNVVVPVSLQQSTSYVWKVRATNSNPYEKSDFASATFTTLTPAQVARPIIDNCLFGLVTAHGFNPGQVTIRVTIDGQIQKYGSDHRVGTQVTEADSNGAIYAYIKWDQPSLLLQLPVGPPWYGAATYNPMLGERVIIDAHDGRKDPNNTKEYLWSDPFSFTWS